MQQKNVKLKNIRVTISIRKTATYAKNTVTVLNDNLIPITAFQSKGVNNKAKTLNHN